MQVYNTLTNRKEEFVPIEEGKVRMYVCGPTVYNFFHIGNARPFVVFDTLRRYFKYRGYEVKFVQNFTDVDDKIINRAKEEGITAPEVSEKYIKEYYEDAGALNVIKADVHPKVSEHIPEIIDFVQKLIDKGYAYEADGDVYYSTRKFADYGKLSGQNIDDLESGARIAIGEVKKDPLEFALWKARKEESEIAWESPWGMGRPGWHIECSTMARKHLGETIDIHGGGQDLRDYVRRLHVEGGYAQRAPEHGGTQRPADHLVHGAEAYAAHLARDLAVVWLVQKARPHELGAQRSDVDAGARKLVVDGARELEHERLRRGVHGEPGLGDDAGDGREVDDARASGHMGEREVAHLDHGQAVEPDHVRRVLLANGGKVPELAEARAVDEPVHARLLAGKLARQHLERGGISEVEREHARGRAAGRGDFVQDGLAASDEPELVKRAARARVQLPHELAAHSRRRARHDGDAFHLSAPKIWP